MTLLEIKPSAHQSALFLIQSGIIISCADAVNENPIIPITDIVEINQTRFEKFLIPSVG